MAIRHDIGVCAGQEGTSNQSFLAPASKSHFDGFLLEQKRIQLSQELEN